MRRNKYVEKIIEQIPKEKLHLGESVRAVIPQRDGSFLVREGSGKEERYDKVILAYVFVLLSFLHRLPVHRLIRKKADR